MAEWTKAAVLKTVDSKGSVGSNPTSSATRSFFDNLRITESCQSGRMGLTANQLHLLRVPGVRIPGSPPSPQNTPRICPWSPFLCFAEKCRIWLKSAGFCRGYRNVSGSPRLPAGWVAIQSPFFSKIGGKIW